LLALPSSSFCSYTTAPPSALYALSLHDALPIWRRSGRLLSRLQRARSPWSEGRAEGRPARTSSPERAPWASSSPWLHSDKPARRSEEHTSELQSRVDLVCRLLLEKKKTR